MNHELAWRRELAGRANCITRIGKLQFNLCPMGLKHQVTLAKFIKVTKYTLERLQLDPVEMSSMNSLARIYLLSLLNGQNQWTQSVSRFSYAE